jgi:CBS domain-containing protein
MMGGALGGVEAMFLPHVAAGFWPLISMGAILGGTMRSPFTGVIFALELTHDINALLPLTIAVFLAHGFTVLTLRRSILTEKVARRGYHLSREYAVDPLEVLFVREVMRTNIVALPAGASPEELARSLRGDRGQDREQRGQHLYPIMDDTGNLAGVVTRRDVQGAIQTVAMPEIAPDGRREMSAIIKSHPVVTYPDEPLRVVVYRMAETGLTRFPVVRRDDPRKLVGMVSLQDLLQARERNWAEERRRERVLRLRILPALRSRQRETSDVG